MLSQKQEVANRNWGRKTFGLLCLWVKTTLCSFSDHVQLPSQPLNTGANIVRRWWEHCEHPKEPVMPRKQQKKTSGCLKESMSPGHAQAKRTEASQSMRQNPGAPEVQSLFQGMGGSWCPCRLISINIFVAATVESVTQLFPHWTSAPGSRLLHAASWHAGQSSR